MALSNARTMELLSMFPPECDIRAYEGEVSGIVISLVNVEIGFIGNNGTFEDTRPDAMKKEKPAPVSTVDYKIVSGDSFDFESKVNVLLDQGYVPVGGVAINPDGLHKFHQAMMKS